MQGKDAGRTFLDVSVVDEVLHETVVVPVVAAAARGVGRVGDGGRIHITAPLPELLKIVNMVD